MTQVCLLDSDRLSALLRDAISWSDHVSSVMVSSFNGSILAYAYRDATPSIKRMRTQSTTMTAAYTVASEDILVFEAQNMGATSVLAPVADHVLLAVTGPEPKLVNGEMHEGANSAHVAGPDEEHEDEEEQQQIRTDLEVVSQELAHLLRGELATLRWPDDI
ncbi:uncharacterized protein A1O9_11866 [Exophiala aquamarina CBS 119918]|uniref:Roadblock/LAMTOR2 domain-containing protein n=1 Tax=Exophiala aquamarina CBS 119918 TaxID=1182545 RepID=A0A072NWJ1_9EURO|nr:uncharacterized protein A1O9_11866 [Exophiala aquamarina CBS 119918]KEF52239.1 hypothetical protein A1O9_11866 [Exophiala aquamarina CBS 119918]